MTKSEYELRIQTVCLAILTIVTLAVTLYLLRIVLVPFILAAFLALVLMPVVNFLMRKLRVGRAIALGLTLLIGFLVVLGTGAFISVSVGQFANSAGEYEQQLTRLLRQAENSKPINTLVNLIGVANTAGANTAGSDGAPAPPAGSGGFRTTLLLPEGAINGIARRLSASVFSVLSNGLLVLLFTAFLLMGSTAPAKPRGGVIGEIESRVQKYIIIKVLSSVTTGFLVFLVLHFLGVRYAMSFGAFAFILNFIPNLGSIVATVLPLPFVLLTPDVSHVTVVLALLLPLSVQFVIGSVVEPKIMGDTLGLHPVVVLMSLIFWGILWGFAGMLLAIPMTASAKIIFARIDVTKPMAAIMEGRLEALDDM
ncbi:MAG: AI-2E family transporter [Candidatus Hydrogenedentes bacterium]|nr:AI-2E family transporter [Candidatus Hydrogenedentota bacterium]